MNAIRRDWPAWLISLVANLCILLVLQSIVYEPRWSDRPAAMIRLFRESSDREHVLLDASVSDLVGNDGESVSLAPMSPAATVGGAARDAIAQEIDELVAPTFVDISVMADMPLQDSLATSFETKGQTEHVSGGVEGAMDRMAFEIEMSLKERQTLVIWLFDASASLRDRRGSIAERFERVYKQLETRGKTEGLYSAVASYGQSLNLLTPQPVADVRGLVATVRDVAIDESGVENVFAAVHQTVNQWHRFRRSEGRWNKMVVIVTDERGDDIDQLEEAITLCKRFGVRVYTLGNAAIFGRKEGFVDYREDDGYVHRNVPVDQGPESAFPHVVRLAYWGGDADSRLHRMSAGYGPYGLTRLCAETGGVFFIMEQNDGSHFDRAVMRNYAPDYRPLRIQDDEIRQDAAKRALVQAANSVEIDGVPIPQLGFRADNESVLRQQVTEAQKPLADFQYQVDKLHALLEQGAPARKSVTDPRWRAGFDLALGRVLAMRVRAYGYNVMLAKMKSEPRAFQGAENNLWRLVPSASIDTGPSVRQSAEQARSLLQQVITEHAGTPWALLAERELNQPLGWEWREGRIDVDAILAGQQPAPAELLDEERERLAETRPKPPTVRPVPKL
ncbi:MAG: VWA domain-containing protein [Planctomycetaceae bacterium]|nr:VWA domain-containing protein [Planctomycetaceae bacterium]